MICQIEVLTLTGINSFFTIFLLLVVIDGGNKWYFVIKIVLTYCENKIVLVIKKNFKKFLRSLEQFIQTVHYGQIHYIRVYEKSNFKSFIIGNLYVKLLAFLEKDPSQVRKSPELCFLRPNLNFFLEFWKKNLFTIIVTFQNDH